MAKPKFGDQLVVAPVAETARIQIDGSLTKSNGLSITSGIPLVTHIRKLLISPMS